MSQPGHLTDAELVVVDAHGSRLARAYAPSWLAAAAELEAAFGFTPAISITNGHPIGAYRTVAEQASLPGAAGAAFSDHTKGRGVDIGNQRRFRNVDEALFLAILAKHGWHNVGSGGKPFPQEPWHFANQSATPAGAGTLITESREGDTMTTLYMAKPPASIAQPDIDFLNGLLTSAPVNLKADYLIALCGDSPGTRANVQLTQLDRLGNEWAADHTGALPAQYGIVQSGRLLSWPHFIDTLKAYLTPLGSPGGAPAGVSMAEVKAEADRVIAAVPTAVENGAAARAAMIKD